MAIAIIVTGIMLGLIIGKAMKFFSIGYGFSNDIENKPTMLKSCLYCNTKIPKDYTKNLCPNCSKPLE